jgi:flagellar hook protein FlgE
MIDGDGFFLVGDKTVADTINASNAESLKGLTLSRVGDFEFKADGYLTDGQGNVVYGFLCTDDTGTTVSDQLVPIRLPRLAATDDASSNTTLNGVKAGDVLFPYQDTTTNALTDDIKGANSTTENTFAQLDSITIDGKTGKISGTTKDSDQLITIGYIAIGNVTNPNGVTQESDTYYKAGDGAGDLTITLLGGVGSDLNTGVDTSGNAIALQYVNGSQNTATGTGGTTTSPAGMQILSAGTTELITGGLEMSTTDLATEISEMITTQRGYQANTRIITVTDDMLEELVNMKR